MIPDVAKFNINIPVCSLDPKSAHQICSLIDMMDVINFTVLESPRCHEITETVIFMATITEGKVPNQAQIEDEN